MKDVTNKKINAYSHASKRSMVLGNHEWIITNDTICAAGEESYTATLSLTTCSGEQFTCSDGLCIPIDQRWENIEMRASNEGSRRFHNHGEEDAY